MQLQLMLTTHIYAEEHLIDWVFEDTEGCGLFEPKDFWILRNHRDYQCTIEYSDDFSIEDFLRALIIHIGAEDYYDEYLTRIYFLTDSLRYSANDLNARFKPLLNTYIDPENTGIVHIEILACMDAGSICVDDGLRYFMHSHEGNRHNEPHVHVSDFKNDREATIALRDLRVLDGNLTSKALKKARHIISSNITDFLKFWNTNTDGLDVDINHFLKIIKY